MRLILESMMWVILGVVFGVFFSVYTGNISLGIMIIIGLCGFGICSYFLLVNKQGK